MPAPVSLTVKRTLGRPWCSISSTASVTVPFSVNLQALDSRLSRICRNLVSSLKTSPASSGRLAALNKRRWYGFVRMQARVARRVARDGALITVSESAKSDICRDFRVSPEQVHIIPLGVDTRLFRPGSQPRVRGRIVAVASADSPLKGIGTLLRAMGKLVTDTSAHLVIVGKPAPATERLAAQLSLADRVTFTHGLSDQAFSGVLASAETAVVPSLYEGFSLPAVEHMASGTPLVASRTGALPEVTGDAAVLVMSEEKARERGLKPKVRVKAMAVAGVDPSVMGIGPVPAVHKALERAKLTLEEIDLIEINEAFAAQTLSVMNLLKVDPERVNVHGGAIALGHPLGCSGARIAATLIHAMAERKARLGLATMCIGAGQGIATIFEAV